MDTIAGWVREQQELVDEAIAESFRASFDHHDWSWYELSQSLDDTWRLSKGEDAFYDRPSAAAMYAAWYQPRRLQQMVQLLLPRFDDMARRRAVEVIDIGAGTGATAWALGLLWRAGIDAGRDMPALRIHAIDSSPFMCRFLKDAWEGVLHRWLSKASERIELRIRCNNWTRVALGTLRSRPDIVAGFLFDHSDRTRSVEVADELLGFADRHAAASITIVSSPAKGCVLQDVQQHAVAYGWSPAPCDRADATWAGTAERVTSVRAEILGSRAPEERSRWNRPVRWCEADVPVCRLQQAEDASDGGLFGIHVQPLPTFNDEQQRALAADSARLKILGTAGSGKSLVLAARVARAVTAATADRSILVSAFNKQMIEQLREWIDERLRDRQGRPIDGCWKRVGGDDAGAWDWEGEGSSGSTVRLTLRNWDKVIKMLDSSSGTLRMTVRDQVERRIREVRRQFGLPEAAFTDILDPDFLAAERHRVMYGLNASTWETYSRVERSGRGERRLQKNRRPRRYVWLSMAGIDDFTSRRLRVLEQVLRGTPRRVYDFVFFDECQDLVPADIEILLRLTAENGALCIAGDPTQSLHVGPSHRAQRLPGLAPIRWYTVSLSGSYRVPLRVSECLRPLAERVLARHETEDDESLLPAARKSSVPGFRPILVWTDDEASAADQVVEILHAYGVRTACFAERATSLRRAVSGRLKRRTAVRDETMKAIKGLERECVVWSLRDPIVADEAVDELVYTALTRTQRILIIVAGPGVGDDLLEILKCLRRDRINPWTRSASDVIDSWYMQELCEIANGAVKLTPAQTPPAPPAGPGSDPG